MTIKTKLYFAYGANLSLASMKSRCPSATPMQSFYLRDWRLKLYNHATIAPAKGYCVAGALWSITTNCENSLDMFEGWPIYYQKQELEQDGARFMVYTMTEPAWGNPSVGYMKLLQQGYDDWNLPQSWLQETMLLKKEHDYDM